MKSEQAWNSPRHSWASFPQGDYQVVLNERSLPENTYCEQISRQVTLSSGKISTIPKFIIKVRENKSE